MSKRFSLGRADAKKADILLDGNTISARHAEIHIDSRGKLLISDLGSSNGTYIIRKGEKINVSSNSIPLVSSDIVSLGGNEFTVDALLSKNHTGSTPSSKAFPVTPSTLGGKMMRCSSCGSVTPQGSACTECGHHV